MNRIHLQPSMCAMYINSKITFALCLQVYLLVQGYHLSMKKIELKWELDWVYDWGY